MQTATQPLEEVRVPIFALMQAIASHTWGREVSSISFAMARWIWCMLTAVIYGRRIGQGNNNERKDACVCEEQKKGMWSCRSWGLGRAENSNLIPKYVFVGNGTSPHVPRILTGSVY